MPRLYPEDQARVDRVLSQGIHRVARRPFRPLMLMLSLLAVLVLISAISYGIAGYYGFV